MADCLLRIQNRNFQTLVRWVLIPVTLVAAIFLPPLLLSLSLAFTLILFREFSFVYSIAEPKSLPTNFRSALGPRSPPAF